jgi:fatty-acyl-CoA synthase
LALNPSNVPAPNYVRRALTLFDGYGDLEALVATDGRRFTFHGLGSAVRRMAAALWNHGVRPGMTVAILATNSAESFFVQLGSHLLGARTVLMQPVTPRPVLRTLVGFVAADVFIYDANALTDLGRDVAQAGNPAMILCIGPGGLGPDLSSPPDVSDLPFDAAAVTLEPETLFQTSGTTGTPKLLRHGERFFSTTARVAEYYRPPHQPRIRHLSLSGSWHAGGQSAALMTWLSGGLYVMLGDFDPETYLAAIPKECITSLHISPADLNLLLDSGRLPDADLRTLYSATICCSPARPARLAQAGVWFGSALNVVYGMSEIPMIAVMPNIADPAHPQRLAACGRPWHDNRIEIRQGTTVLPAGQVGEIWVTGSFLTEGYYNLPDVNASNMVDGWLRTGDVGRCDEDGYLYIVDRVADAILTDVAGLVVYCRPLEDALTEHPEVRQAAVIGVPDDIMGEAAHAYVVLAPGATVTPQALRQFVADQLSAEWSPREVEIVESLPTNEQGKVDKKILRERYEAAASAQI